MLDFFKLITRTTTGILEQVWNIQIYKDITFGIGIIITIILGLTLSIMFGRRGD